MTKKIKLKQVQYQYVYNINDIKYTLTDLHVAITYPIWI